MNWQDVRAQFPALEHWTYLNTATFGQLPRRAVPAMDRHLARRDEFACQDFASWFDDIDLLRGQIALLINCQAEDLAYVPNASIALSLLFGGLDWKPGDQVLTLENEFPNHYYLPPRLMQTGVELVETPFDRFYEAVNEHTRLVAVIMALFTVATAVFFRSNFADPNMQIHFLKNIAMAGGLLQVAAFGAGSLSLDALLRGKKGLAAV